MLSALEPHLTVGRAGSDPRRPGERPPSPAPPSPSARRRRRRTRASARRTPAPPTPSARRRVDHLHPGLRLARLRGLVAEALDEALHPSDVAWRLSTSRPAAISRAAFSARHACQGPAKYRARPASSSSTEVPTDSRNQRSWATSTTAASRSTGSARATPSTRCRGGSWARRAAAGRAAPRARGRARRVSARRRRSRGAAGRARPRRSRARVRSRCATVAPPIAAGVLEAALGARRTRRGWPRRSRRPPSALEPRELALDLGDPPEPRQHVLAKRDVHRSAAGAGRAARRGRPACIEIVPSSGQSSPDERSQQRRLAAAVAAGERHALAGLELERDAREERPRSDSLGEARAVTVEMLCDA